MAKKVEYQVVLLRIEQAKEFPFWEKLRPSLEKQAIEYQKEMAEITGKAETNFSILTGIAMPGPSTLCLAADRKYNVYGFIYIEYDMISKTLWTSHVYVDKGARQCGVYKTMMERVKKFAHDAGFKRIMSLVWTRNTPSMVAHAKGDFEAKWTGFEMEI